MAQLHALYGGATIITTGLPDEFNKPGEVEEADTFLGQLEAIDKGFAAEVAPATTKKRTRDEDEDENEFEDNAGTYDKSLLSAIDGISAKDQLDSFAGYYANGKIDETLPSAFHSLVEKFMKLKPTRKPRGGTVVTEMPVAKVRKLFKDRLIYLSMNPLQVMEKESKRKATRAKTRDNPGAEVTHNAGL